MNAVELIQEISVKDVDVDKFVQLVISEDHTRNEVIKQLLTNPNIMVYYHCYYVVDKASQARPELFYPYWPGLVPLLKHKNSYHRDIALTIIANLTRVDQDDLFSTIYHDYFEHMNDNKFMTGQCCVRNSGKIIRNKPKLRNQIIGLLLDVDNQCTYTEKQKELMKSDVLEILDVVYGQAIDKEGVDRFIRVSVNSISPKTRQKAKELVEKHCL
jgi:hypothetical protein